MIYTINELSHSKVNSVDEVKEILQQFVKANIKASENNFSELRLYEKDLINLYGISFSNIYNIDNWLSDPDVNSDIQDKFRLIVTSFPLIANDEQDFKLEYSKREYSIEFDGHKCIAHGLGAANLLSTLSISFLTNCFWRESFITLNQYTLSEAAEETYLQVKVRHFYSEDSFDFHKEWIDSQLQALIIKSADLWTDRQRHFPDILLGDEVEDQLKYIGLSKKLDQIYDTLKKLNDFAKLWTTGGFSLSTLISKSGLDISGESESTKKRFSVSRKFKLSNGSKVQFDLHIKLSDLRIYFLPDEREKKITVGYIGKHLRTSTDK
jgi:hypothetical protein